MKKKEARGNESAREQQNCCCLRKEAWLSDETLRDVRDDVQCSFLNSVRKERPMQKIIPTFS